MYMMQKRSKITKVYLGKSKSSSHPSSLGPQSNHCYQLIMYSSEII